jgi:hypothetical protein
MYYPIQVQPTNGGGTSTSGPDRKGVEKANDVWLLRFLPEMHFARYAENSGPPRYITTHTGRNVFTMTRSKPSGCAPHAIGR